MGFKAVCCSTVLGYLITNMERNWGATNAVDHAICRDDLALFLNAAGQNIAVFHRVQSDVIVIEVLFTNCVVKISILIDDAGHGGKVQKRRIKKPVPRMLVVSSDVRDHGAFTDDFEVEIGIPDLNQ